jgi:YVTN family beta-propeller protein
VRISPDSQFAYVLNVAGTDRISFIQLDGADSFIISQLPAGQTGSANGYTYTETSGIELSDDGLVLAVCDSFNDYVRLFDTVNRVQIAQVPVGDFPIRAAFSPDGNRVYVSNAFDDSVSVVEFNGANWSNIDTVFGIDFPLTIEVDDANEWVYVGNSGSNPGIRVIDTATLSIKKFLPFADGSPRDSFLSSTDSILYIASTNSELVRIDAAGMDSAIIDSFPLASGPSDLAFNDAAKVAVTSQPIPDGVDVIDFGGGKPGDVNNDGVVDVNDLFAVINAWGPCPGCPEDTNGDDVVNIDDLFVVINNWGT